MKEADRFARYLAGELQAGETAALEREAAADPALAARLRAARAAWSGASAPEHARIDVDAAWRRFAVRAAELDRSARPAHSDVLPLHREAAPTQQRARPPRRVFTGMRVAAAVLLLAGGALLWRVTQAGQTVATDTGEVRLHMLADGSEVRLGPASRLVVRRGYGTDHRTVALQGEAFFRSVHSDAPPLIVETAAARVRDVGTAFVVRAFETDGSVDVIVTDGEVWLGRKDAATGDGMLLHAGQRGRLTGRAPLPQPLGAVDTTVELAWLQGRVVFEQATLRQVVLQLQRWYGVEASIADERIASRRLTAIFADEPLPEVLNVIARSLDITFRRDGDRVIFDARAR